MTYNIWETEQDIQLIPDGEEIIHQLDVMCGCKPEYNMENDYIIEVFHNTFFGESYTGFVFNPIKQLKDC